jgi:uncharacterized protein YjbI with pentapeptide repeats
MAIPLQPLSFNPSQDEWNAWMSQVVQWAQGVNTVTTGLPVTAQGIQNLVYNTQSTANISLLEIVPTLPASGSFDGQLVYQQSDENLYTWSAANNQWKHTAPQYKGDWVSTTLYYAGDEVSYQGLVYIATADNQNKEPDINPSVWAELSQTIPNLDGIANGSVYGRTLLTYLFNGRPWNFKGTYSATTTYFQSDEVYWTGNYYLYINPTAKSGVTPTNDGTNWVLVGPGTLDDLLNGSTFGKVNLSSLSGGVPYTFRGAYSATTTYRQGDEVSYQNNYYLYIDSVPTSGATPTNGGYWILVGPTELSSVPGTIAAGQIPNAIITGTMIQAATITGTNIANASITGSKIAAATITGSNIANAAITASQIANLTITASQIANLTITGGQIANTTIDKTKIVPGTLSEAAFASQSGSVEVSAPTTILTLPQTSDGISGYLIGRVNLSITTNAGFNATVEIWFGGHVLDSATVVMPSGSGGGSIPVTLIIASYFQPNSNQTKLVVGGTPNVTVSGASFSISGIY